jgi:hypothetical protein
MKMLLFFLPCFTGYELSKKFVPLYMNLFENKIWEVEQKPDFLKLTFHGKYAEGLKTLTWALLGFEIVLALFILFIFATLGYTFFIVVLLVGMTIVGFILWWNDKTRREKHFVTIENNRIKLVKTNGQKTISKELDLSQIKEIKMTASQKSSDLADTLLLLLGGLFIWFIVGAGQKDSTPAVYTETEHYPFFEFGKPNEKKAVISFLNHYLGKEFPPTV